MKETEKEKSKYAVIAITLLFILIALLSVMRSCWNDVTTDLENRETERLTRQFTNALTREQREQIVHQIFQLNGEIVVNNIIIDAPKPYYALENTKINFVEGVNLLALTIVPLQPIAEKLGYEIFQRDVPPIINIGNASFRVGSLGVRIDGNPAFGFSVAPYIDENGTIFVPLNFFRDALGKTVYIFEGQVVIETYSDMR